MTPEQVVEKINSIIAEKTANSVSKEELDAFKSQLSSLEGKADNTDVATAPLIETRRLRSMLFILSEVKVIRHQLHISLSQELGDFSHSGILAIPRLKGSKLLQ